MLTNLQIEIEKKTVLIFFLCNFVPIMKIIYFFYIFGTFGEKVEDDVRYKWTQSEPPELPLRINTYRLEIEREQNITARVQNPILYFYII